MKYLAVLGRQAEISVAELSALFSDVKQIVPNLATFSCLAEPNIDRLGGCLKIGVKLEVSPLEYLKDLPEGKITLGVSDYSNRASRKTATLEALKLKKILMRHERSVRVVENKEAILSTATSLYNGLSGKNPKKVELIKVNNEWFRVIGVQDIDAYAKRDQARPARDAKVGMLPPKLAQILINLCGPLKEGARVLDPFCGTGVVLQEAMLMGYEPYGTDIEPRMVEYSKKNLKWLSNGMLAKDFSSGALRGACPSLTPSEKLSTSIPFSTACSDSCLSLTPFENLSMSVSQGDATNFTWQQPIDAVACEGYLGKPMSQVPVEIKLKTEKQECGAIILGFLKNLAKQIKVKTPVVIAMPAWLRENGKYSRLEILDEIENLGYNVENKSREGLLYHREGQIVARDIIILRKK